MKNGKYSSIGRAVDCGSKGCRFDSFFLPMNIFNLFFFYNHFFYSLSALWLEILRSFFFKFYFLATYYSRNELIWQEGLLIDFLQKKITDNWIKRFLIHSSYLFNERFVFDKIIRFYLDLFVWPMHKLFTFEFSNVANTLFITIFLFIFFFFILFFFYLFLLFF